MPLSANMRAAFEILQTGTPDFGSAQFQGTIAGLISMADGIAIDQVDLFYAKERPIASGANDDIDLNGTLVGPLGTTVNLAKLVGLLIINKPKAAGLVNTTNLTIGGGTNPVVGFMGGTTPTIGPLRPGGILLLGSSALAGLATVTPATGDILRIANSAGASALYQIALLGRSA